MIQFWFLAELVQFFNDSDPEPALYMRVLTYYCSLLTTKAVYLANLLGYPKPIKLCSNGKIGQGWDHGDFMSLTKSAI